MKHFLSIAVIMTVVGCAGLSKTIDTLADNITSPGTAEKIDDAVAAVTEGTDWGSIGQGAGGAGLLAALAGLYTTMRRVGKKVEA